MINDLLPLLSYENIYNCELGCYPFLVFINFTPQNQLTIILAQSIIVPLLLASGYAFLSYNIYLEGNILEGFELYSGLDGLYSMFANEALLLIFWLHFLAISLFVGAWIVEIAKNIYSKNYYYSLFNFNFHWPNRISYLLVYEDILC